MGARKEEKNREIKLFVEITACNRAIEDRSAAEKQAEADQKIVKDGAIDVLGIDGGFERREYVGNTEPYKRAKKKGKSGIEKAQGVWRDA